MDPALRFLSLDMSTHTGYAVVQNKKFVKYGVRDFSLKTGQHNGHKGIKFYNFLRELGRIDCVFFEDVMFAGSYKNEDGKIIHTTNDGREGYLGLKMVMNMFCAGFGIHAYPIYPSQLKKQFAGHGHAKKEDMCRAARAMGWTGGMENTGLHNDEADAIAIMVVMMKDRYGITPTF